MASSVEGDELTAAHRLAQARIGTQTIARMLTAWQVLDPEDPEGSMPDWLQVVAAVISTGRSESSRVAQAYFSRYRNVEVGDVLPFTPRLAPQAPREQVDAVMRINLLSRTRNRVDTGSDFSDSLLTARVETSRAAQRLTLAGGRDTIDGAIGSDESAIGYARAASGEPCHFCAMLASRGPVYKEDSFRRMAVHDGCNCSLEPVYFRSVGWPRGSREYQELWNAASDESDGTAPTDVIFRRIMEDRFTPTATDGDTDSDLLQFLEQKLKAAQEAVQ